MVLKYTVTSKMAWAGVIAIVVATFAFIFFYSNPIVIRIFSVIGILGVFSLSIAVAFQNKEDEETRQKQKAQKRKV